MKVIFKIKAKKQWSIKNRELVKEAIAFASNILKLPAYGKLVVTLAGNMDTPDWEFRGLSFYAKKSPFITLYYSTAILDTIFHELTHVAQYLNGDLEDSTQFVYWKGSKFNRNLGEETLLEYIYTPWEIEARAKAIELIALFNNDPQLFLDINYNFLP